MNGNQPYYGNQGHPGYGNQGHPAPNTVYIGFDQPINVAPHPQAPYGHQGYQTRQSMANHAQVDNGVYFKEKKKPNTFGLLGFVLGACGLATGALPIVMAGGAASTIGVFRKRRFLAMTGLLMALFNPATIHFANQMTRPNEHVMELTREVVETDLVTTNEALAQAEGRVMTFYQDNQQTWPDDIQGNMLVAELQDAWGTSLRFDKMPDRLLVRSAGPDGEAETADDVVLALHHFRRTDVASAEQ